MTKTIEQQTITTVSSPMSESDVPSVCPSVFPVPVEQGAIKPVGDIEDAFAAYQDLQKKLDHMMPDQIMEISGKKFRKKGYWHAVGTAFNLSLIMVSEKESTRDKDWGFLVTYQATAPSGRTATGDGSCFASEKSRGRMQATVHNVRAHAHTRAMNRAISNLVGFGEVTADEVSADELETPDITLRDLNIPDTFEEDCPECQKNGIGAFLVEKVSTKEGPFYGKRFIGCSRFPDCKYFRPIDKQGWLKHKAEKEKNTTAGLSDS